MSNQGVSVNVELLKQQINMGQPVLLTEKQKKLLYKKS